jgi:hypothetical protein
LRTKRILHPRHRLLRLRQADSLRLDVRFSARENTERALNRILARLPGVTGRPISVSFRPSLTAHRGKLLSRKKAGTAVHAGCFIRKRQIVMETELLDCRKELTRIFLHELFHFAWNRIGNQVRRSWEEMLCEEIRDCGRGELGWSAEQIKLGLTLEDAACRKRQWRDYASESFCDTAAWFFGSHRSHPEFTLARKHRARRRKWFEQMMVPRGIAL